jgi:hypothetical protein
MITSEAVYLPTTVLVEMPFSAGVSTPEFTSKCQSQFHLCLPFQRTLVEGKNGRVKDGSVSRRVEFLDGEVKVAWQRGVIHSRYRER